MEGASELKRYPDDLRAAPKRTAVLYEYRLLTMTAREPIEILENKKKRMRIECLFTLMKIILLSINIKNLHNSVSNTGRKLLFH